jgi:hypothetical protein
MGWGQAIPGFGSLLAARAARERRRSALVDVSHKGAA